MRLYYTEIDLPTGRALAAATDAGLAHLELRPGSRSAWLKGLRAGFGVEPVRDEARFQLLRRELDAWFAGGLREFTVPLDVNGTPFQLEVWKALGEVAYGTVVTYGMLAVMVGRPKSARAVGGALNANPVPIIIPCHRVVAAGGGIGGFGCGVDIKRRLLKIEGSLEAEPANTKPSQRS